LGELRPSSASPIGRVAYRRGASIIQEGVPADVLYTILSGAAKLCKTTASGRAIGFGISAPGSPLGAEWILQGSMSAVMAVALDDTICAAVPRQMVAAFLDEHPLLLREVVCEIGMHERHLMNRIAEVAGARVEVRFAHLFLELAVKVGVRQHGQITIRAPLLRQDLADLTGTTVESSIRLMTRWGRLGIVTTQPGGFVIRDWAALERLRRS
jgi:CRP/FNR family transcriptional regulator